MQPAWINKTTAGRTIYRIPLVVEQPSPLYPRLAMAERMDRWIENAYLIRAYSQTESKDRNGIDVCLNLGINIF